MKKLVLSLFFSASSLLTFAQYDDANSHIGVQVGYSNLAVYTNNFNITPQGGWCAGFTTRGMLYNKFDLVYGIDFHQANFSTMANYNGSFRYDEVKYQLTCAQIQFLGSYRAISDRLNFDFGPIFQLNDRLTSDKKFDDNVLQGSSLKVSEIADVSKFNVFLGAGIVGGLTHVRISLFYQYSLNNFFSKLNTSEAVRNAGLNLNGHLGLFTAKAVFYL